MCGIAAIAGAAPRPERLGAMARALAHRGPDDEGIHADEENRVGLVHRRLSIIDLSPAGHGPMSDADGTCWLTFNGEIYNYLELRAELSSYPFRSGTDTEVILAAYRRWGEACVERFIGMFALVLWDANARTLFAARDRFGVKPLYMHREGSGLLLASEIKALHAAGAPAAPDEAAWATYLSNGLSDHGARTFWSGIEALPAGHTLTWRDGTTTVRRWYDLAARAGDADDARSDDVVRAEYRDLLIDSVRLRFRSDVPVGINLSGGLDSATLLGVVHAVLGEDSDVKAFTFVTGDDRYDELPWVQQMLERTKHPSIVCALDASEVPDLAASVQRAQDEPFGGIPTLAYARVFERARAEGVIVLLDGQGMDEQWAGYDYYARAGEPVTSASVQAAHDPAFRPECLAPEFAALAEPLARTPSSADAVRDRQIADATATKIPRALRYNDRVSMRASTELREPFLDHRLFELALRQPRARKIAGGVHKAMLRDVARDLLPGGVVEAPKRPLQTPQREWLRGPLAGWADGLIERAIASAEWLDPPSVRAAWKRYRNGEGDNSYPIWQWLNLGLWLDLCAERARGA